MGTPVTKSRIKRLMAQSPEVRELVEALRAAIDIMDFAGMRSHAAYARDVLAKYEEAKA